MNTPDDDQYDLHDDFLRAIGPEPAMQSMPGDDLVRGRRLVRRRRLTAVTVAAVTVPMMALGGWALASGLGSGSASGASQLQPADSSSQDPTSTASCAIVAVGTGGFPGASAPPISGQGHASPGRIVSGDKAGVRAATRRALTLEKGMQPPVGNATPQSANLCAGSGTDGGTITSDCPDSSSVPTTAGGQSAAGDSSSCDATPGDPSSPPGVDRITGLLQGLDPSGTHTGDSLSTGGSVVDAGDQPSALYAGLNWSDGDLEGALGLSVEDAATAGPGGDCQDHSIADGPAVTCVQQTLPDGTKVLVGHGQQGGAERVTVRYDRPDGTVVIATADEATDQWWTDGTGAAPLTSPPVTVDQLIGLVQDPGNHL